MIEILRPSLENLGVLEKPTGKFWINVVSPTEEDISKIKSFIDVPENILTSLKDIDEIPSIEEHGGFTFIIIRVPYNSPKAELEYYTVPIGVFVTKEIVMTVCYFENEVIEKLKNQRFHFRKTQLLFRLLLVSAKLYLNYLKDVRKKMYEIEAQLELTQKNKAIMDLLELEKALVYFNTSLQSNQILVERVAKASSERSSIARMGIAIKSVDDKKLIEHVIDENKQAIEMSGIYSNILSNTLDAFASVISNNLNIVIKILTSITIVLALPTLVASIYGMNVKLPFQQSAYAFFIVMVLSFAIAFIALLILWKEKFI